MAIVLGVDTGGTYTDAVLIRGEAEVVASAKALTTRHDLAVGVGNAVTAVLRRSGIRPDEIVMASLSTTLATNALVEGQGGRVALVYIGFREADLDRHGLRGALKGDPVLVIPGGHDHAGGEAGALDREAIERFARECDGAVSGYAVAARFATRNPAHEQAAARIIGTVSGVPVTCSHHLSARLNGPKRAVTAVLNARLTGMIDGLIGRARDRLRAIGITAPMMVVRGDGALMSAEQALRRPIETILSGPAASAVGARWLTGAKNAMVSDIGGTTTDVALLRDGRPAIDPAGARVGGMRTMVEAVAMRTIGLGGDSEVHINGAGISLGPRRAVPVSLIAMQAGAVVHEALDRQLSAPISGEYDGRFVHAVPGVSREGVDARAAVVLDRIGDAVHPLGAVLKTRMELTALGRLRERGLVQLASVTPSDAAHVLGQLQSWDADAARKALALFARRRVSGGEALAPSAEALAGLIFDQVCEQTTLALLEAVFSEEGGVFEGGPEGLARHVLMRRALDGHRGLLRLDAGLEIPVIGLGAPAANYYPAVGARLNATMLLPEHGGVANAIGAVVGRVSVRRSGTVTAHSEGRYRVHLAGGPLDFSDPDEAMAHLETELAEEARAEARQAGAEDVQVVVTRDTRIANVEAREVFVEAILTVEASGRPRVATG